MKKVLFCLITVFVCVGLFAQPQSVIEVSTDVSGTLYLQDNEIAVLWANGAYTIPIERPGTYLLRLQLFSGMAKVTSVSINTQSVTKVDFSTIAESYLIGSIGPAGGIIFYDKGVFSDGWRYLEAAPIETEFRRIEWGRGINVPGTGIIIGSGRQNTELIVARLTQAKKTGRAAQLCAALNFGEFADWFLPSRDELDLMYKNLSLKGLGGFRDTYWSSSQNRRKDAHVQDFGNKSGRQFTNNKFDARSVRAIRSF
ncbi:MAG: DUF1566 domain-containing protein [Treponema sp.]|nr:DUF1566 domain-containing protein [Treponema sp.]